ncbi:MAG: hypothetical protein ABWX59_04980 [Microbacteriaceae bacterium]
MPRSRPTPTRWARVARGWSAAAAATLLAAVAHGLVDGAFPQLLTLVLATVFGGLVCMLLAGRRVGRLRLGLMVLASQGILHTLFALFGAGAGAVADATASESAAAHHQHAGLIALTPAPASGAHPDMWLLHAVAAVATYALIRYGMVAVAGLIITAGLVVAPLLRAAQLAPQSSARPIRLTVQGAVAPRGLDRVLTAFRRRGPPVGSFA